MDYEKMDRKDLIIIVALVLISFFIRFPGVPNIAMYPDEWIYWTDAHRILSVQFAPVRPDIFNYTSPFFSYIGAGSTPFFGNDLDTFRIISVIFGSLTVPFLYLFGKEIYDRKVGLLAAVLLAFSAYHALYSRIIMLEAFSLFFITAFLYFFWRTQHAEGEKKDWVSAILAGAMLGLAIDAKYIALFLIPAVLGYLLWTSGLNPRAFLDRKIVVMFVTAFLFFLPLLYCLFSTGVGFHGMLYYSMEKYQKTGAQSRLSSLSVTDIAGRGTDTVTGVFAWGSDTLGPAGDLLFTLSVLLLIIITLILYLVGFARREKEASFLLISVAILHILLFVISPYKHYYNYTLPFYFVMISHIAVKGFEGCREPGNVPAMGIAILSGLVIFFIVLTGVTSPFWDGGEYAGVNTVMQFIKNDVEENNLEGPVIIGTTFREVLTAYWSRQHDFSAASVRIIELTGEFEKSKYKVDLEKIHQYQPDYLIFSELTYGRYYLDPQVEQELVEDYRIMKDFHQYFLESIVMKRVHPSSRNSSTAYDAERKGEISKAVFQESIPPSMVVGKPYPARLQVKNTGNTRTTYYVALVSDKFVVFVDKPVKGEITLDGGESGFLQYNIVPFVEYEEDLLVEAELYIIPRNVTPEDASDPESENWARQKMDFVSTTVRRITLP